MAQWYQGTCRVVNGSQTVTFDGADLASAGIAGGELFFLPGSGIPYIVATAPVSLGSPSQETLTLTGAYQGATASGVDYKITTSITPNQSLPYPEFKDVDTATIVKELAVLLDSKLGASLGSSGFAGRVVYLDASGNLTTEAALAYNDATDTLSAVNLTLSGTGTFNGPVVIGDAVGDTVTVNAGSVSIPNNLDIDSGTMYIDAANNRVLFGGTSAQSVRSNAVTFTPATQVLGTGGAGSSDVQARFQASATGPNFFLAKSRGATVGDFTVVQNNDVLGMVVWNGADGVDFAEAARISAEVDGTPGSNDMPTRVVVSTAADATQSPVDRLKIDSQGNVIANASGSALSTSATGGFTYLPTAAGTATGVPGAVTGAGAAHLDSTNQHFSAYLNGGWKKAPMGTFVAAAASPVAYGANVGPQIGSPTGVSIVEWLSILNISGAVRYVPLFA